MTSEKQMIEIDFSNPKQLCELMRDYNDMDMIFGKNDEGEDTHISINSDHIVLETFQKNHWIRKNIYWEDGTVEETFEGKWS